jgi:hypothetical protein
MRTICTEMKEVCQVNVFTDSIRLTKHQSLVALSLSLSALALQFIIRIRILKITII